MRYYRPTVAEINLRKLAYNFRLVKKLVSPQTKILVTVKADAYGHGLIPTARTLVESGADFFGVASIDEGIHLRNAGIKIPILILGAVLKDDVGAVLDYNLTATLCELETAKALNERARRRGSTAGVHVKVDTGMNRIGVAYQDMRSYVNKLRSLKNLRLEGLFTHFACADMDKDFTYAQIGLFNSLVNRLRDSGIGVPCIHAANSMGVIGYPQSHFTMVRPGLIIYGLNPKHGIGINVKPVLSLKTKVVFIKKVAAGCGVSYGRTYVTKRSTRIAVLPIGYGDGYPRNLSNKAPVLIRGRRFIIAGMICMDQIMVDVGKAPVNAGDEAVLIGSQGGKTITAEELAGLAGTIPYEIVCGLGSRIPRVYV